MTARLYCLDASIYIFRAYFSQPAQFYSEQGYSLHAVQGYLTCLLRFLHAEQPSRVLVAFDESLGQGFREALYSGYKSQRALPDDELAFQLRCCRAVSEALGLACCADEQFEADDLLATAASAAQQWGDAVTVLSRDKDLAQILRSDADRLQDIGRDAQTRLAWQMEKGVNCEALADYLAVAGDRVDGIPGLPGVGEGTAKVIFQHFSSLEAIFNNLDALASLPVRGAKGLAQRFSQHRDALFLYRQLTQLRRDVPLDERCLQGLRHPAEVSAIGAASGGLPEALIERLLARYSRALNWG